MLIMLKWPEITFADLERRYRALGDQVRTWLLAAPMHLLPGDCVSKTLDGVPQPYWVWICVNGGEEAVAQMAEFDIPPEDNIKRLEKCGFTMLKN